MALELMRGGWFPERWDIPVAMGLGVVLTGYLGDTIAGFVSGFVPAEWLNPVSEIIIGVLLWVLGGWIGADMSRWFRLFSLGAFAVGIADAVTVLLGLTTAAAPVRVIKTTTSKSRPAVTTGKSKY